MKVTKREWLDYFRVYGQYQYGQDETVEYPEYLTSLGSNQHTYSRHIGVTYLAVAKRYDEETIRL